MNNSEQKPQSCQTDVCGSFLFDKALLEKAIIKQPEYVIGVDTYDKDALAYCFGRKVDGVFEIMLSKTMRDEKEFKQEVENLAKHFNAMSFGVVTKIATNCGTADVQRLGGMKGSAKLCDY